MTDELAARMDKCERETRRLRRLLAAQSLLLGALLSGWVAGCGSAAAGEPARDVVRAREIVVVDKAGVERVRIGGDLPDAVIAGKRIPRGEQAAGVLLYDASGQERGGYVTWEPSGNVGLTLDTRKGQVVAFVAGPEDASALMLRHAGDMIELRSDPDGSRLTAIKAGTVVLQEPPVAALTPATCDAYKQSAAKSSAAQAMGHCKRRFNEKACGACLQ